MIQLVTSFTNANTRQIKKIFTTSQYDAVGTPQDIIPDGIIMAFYSSTRFEIQNSLALFPSYFGLEFSKGSVSLVP